MSIKTWKDKYYPINATKVKKKDQLGAIEHSLLKWKGLKPKALEKHGLFGDEDGIRAIGSTDCEPENYLDVNGDTCALCHITNMSCHTCPITIATGNRCDLSRWDNPSPFKVWQTDQNPKPMIAVLKKTLKHYQAKAKTEKVCPPSR